ncbi:MAG TPA: ATP-binding protein [Syntrophales bacterium]|mgnify:FL=1|nr:ATP-binding protein [Syntrophales bacterium]
MSQFHKAERKKGKLRLAIAGPAGSGKTYSALLIALGLGGRIAMIDTERGSGELYDHLGEYDACTIHPPFEPKKYVETIRAAEDLGYETIIIDSLSHAWVGQGGLLDVHGHIADKTGNSWSAWRQVTPKHNELVDAMLQSKCHIIATMRSKMEYAQVEENGKKQVKKLGMSPIQRDGMEYEFTVFIDLDQQHTATTTKDRTTLFDGQYFVPTVETGKTLLAWLENNGQASPGAVAQEKPLTGQMKEESQENRGKAAAMTKTEATALQQKAASTQLARQTDETGEGSVAPMQGEAKPDMPAGMTDGLKTLFARIGALDLPREGYKRYCYKRYGIASMTEMSPEQIAEQAKLLDSLKRPARLKEFRTVLEGFGGNGQGAGGSASMSAPSLNAVGTEAAPVSTRGAGRPASIPVQAVPGAASAAGGFDLF